MSARRSWLAVLLAAVVSACAALALGCGASATTSGAARPLPSWTGRATDLFDDEIEPAAVGLDFQKSYNPRSDPQLRERAQVSDGVVRVRVATVTSKKDGPEAVYQIGLHVVEKLGGPRAPEGDFDVTITKASESHGIMKSFESRLVGYSFVAFVHDFVRADGDREVHFHLAPDTKEVKSAIGDAMALAYLKQ
jgi:hypothetical protein